MLGCGEQTELTVLWEFTGIRIDWLRRLRIPDNGVSGMRILLRDEDLLCINTYVVLYSR